MNMICRYKSFYACRRFAFTMAEFLITLAIIGVVAALTLPTIINKYQEKVTVVKLKKVYNTLNNAYHLAQIENGDFARLQFVSTEYEKNHELFFNLLKPYLNVSKICGKEQGCLAGGYVKSLDGTNYYKYDESSEYKVVLQDGVVLVFYAALMENGDWVGNVKVDINGKNGPYVLGRDFFCFNIEGNDFVPSGGPEDSNDPYPFEEHCNMSKPSRNNGWGCTAWIIKNENMDYLRCNDLSWNGKHKCSDKSAK